MRRRLGVFLLLVTGGLVTAALLLSDRAPVIYADLVDRSYRVVRRTDQRMGLGVLPSKSDLPVDAAEIGHLVLFAAATVVIGVVLRRRVAPVMVALGVFAMSLAFEVVQPLLSATRLEEGADVVSNGVGVLAGFVVLTLVLRIRRLRRSRTLTW